MRTWRKTLGKIEYDWFFEEDGFLYPNRDKFEEKIERINGKPMLRNELMKLLDNQFKLLEELNHKRAINEALADAKRINDYSSSHDYDDVVHLDPVRIKPKKPFYPKPNTTMKVKSSDCVTIRYNGSGVVIEKNRLHMNGIFSSGFISDIFTDAIDEGIITLQQLTDTTKHWDVDGLRAETQKLRKPKNATPKRMNLDPHNPSDYNW